MNMRTGFTEGEICWTDLQTSDVPAAKAFYAAVFGWRFEDLPTPDGRSYAQAFLGEDLVTVIAPQNPQQSPLPPTPLRVSPKTPLFVDCNQGASP